MLRIFLIFLFTLFASTAIASPPPIIDVHVHASSISDFEKLMGKAPIPHCVPMTDYPVPKAGSSWREIFQSKDNPCKAIWSPVTNEELLKKNLEILKRRNVFAVTGGPLLSEWRKASPDRITASLDVEIPEVSLESVRESLASGNFMVFGELAVQYVGMTPDDPALEPYWALFEKLDIPVGIHIGTGPVGAPYIAFDKYRARLHSALLLEEVLIKHPGLRVYIMHAGWPMLDDLLAVLWTHPQVYIDTGAISWALPRAEFHNYLRRIVESGFGKRVLFGSDQMVWPETMEIAIESIESAEFLTAEQKRDIFFNNAARFLRLSQKQIDSMQK